MSNLSKPKQIAAETIDLVVGYLIQKYYKIEELNIDLRAVGKTLIHGEDYYEMEDEIAEKINETLRDRRLPIEDALRDVLDREPTDEEIHSFKEYLLVDVPDWINGNARSFAKDRGL